MKGNVVKSSKRTENVTGKEIVSKITRNSILNSKILIHNGILAMLYGMAMFLTGTVIVYLSNICTAFFMGRFGVFEIDTLYEYYTGADAIERYVLTNMPQLLIFLTTIISTVGVCLFFGFKIENALISNLKKRLWHKDKKTGEIVKPEF